ncbi:hypothetical protein JXB28_01030 [Candidatus Woesearchaeota archaeon]|nr:hypothetical protein [Candidatus Woesearchaeota archaeon]
MKKSIITAAILVFIALCSLAVTPLTSPSDDYCYLEGIITSVEFVPEHEEEFITHTGGQPETRTILVSDRYALEIELDDTSDNSCMPRENFYLRKNMAQDGIIPQEGERIGGLIQLSYSSFDYYSIPPDDVRNFNEVFPTGDLGGGDTTVAGIGSGILGAQWYHEIAYYVKRTWNIIKQIVTHPVVIMILALTIISFSVAFHTFRKRRQVNL